MKLINVEQDIKGKIYTVRGLQVMLDRDLAELYGVKSIRLREQVKRNIERFPIDFMFQLTEFEVELMVSQNAIPSKKYLGGSLPYVFTEQGVASISGVLTNKIAIDTNVKIIRAFVNMRKFISNNVQIFQRLETLESKQFKTDEKIDNILNAIEDKSLKPKQGIFYNGQVFDAYKFVSDLVRDAKESIVLIDNFVDDTTLLFFSKNQKIDVTIYTHTISKQLKHDLDIYNSQYKKIDIKNFKESHDRFMIIDNKDIYHIGASLKDLGKKWFAFSKFDIDIINILDRLKNSRDD